MIDQCIKDNLMEAERTLFCASYPNTSVHIVNSLRDLERLADNEELGFFEVVVGHMSFKDLDDFMDLHRRDMFWSRMGIVTDEIVTRELSKVVMGLFSPDFLSSYSDKDFIRQQINKRRITLIEAERRGRELLTSAMSLDLEGQLIRRERDY